MKFKRFFLFSSLICMLLACSPSGGVTPEPTPTPTPEEKDNKVNFADQSVKIYGKQVVIEPIFSKQKEDFTVSYEGNNIRIDDNKYIVAIKSNTTTKVTITTTSGATCTFNVTVPESKYNNRRDAAFSETEGWFNSTTVNKISNMGKDFMNGIDISSSKALYDNGTKFYNADGDEESLYYMLKDAGVNWIRLKLWVDPYTSQKTSYGGGIGDLESTLWMAKEAKYAGLKVLLDFHYSDYWTHPAQQILPKAWANVKSADELANRIKQYTTETLNTFKDNNCLPEMVQLGNEISSGSFLQLPGPDSETFSDNYEPQYLTGKTNFAYSAKAGSENMNKYLSAGIEGVKAVDKNIKTVVHWAKGSSISASVINNFFRSITADYDYAGLSLYPYYCFNTIDVANDILSNLNISKPWFIAETSYPFTSNSYVSGVTQHAVSNDSTNINSINEPYPFSPVGQANLIHDLTEIVTDNGGKGVFYWEGAWVPNKNVGWAAKGSKCTWSNQGFFSYGGKALANLNLFKQMSPSL